LHRDLCPNCGWVLKDLAPEANLYPHWTGACKEMREEEYRAEIEHGGSQDWVSPTVVSKELWGERAMTFEEYARDLMIDPDDRDWTLAKDAFDAGYTQCQFEINAKLGDAGNEAEKDTKRKAAIGAIFHLLWPNGPGDYLPMYIDKLDAIIKEAQGWPQRTNNSSNPWHNHYIEIE
jgi:hypothetical protein